MKKNIKKIVSIIIVLTLIAGIGSIGISASAASGPEIWLEFVTEPRMPNLQVVGYIDGNRSFNLTTNLSGEAFWEGHLPSRSSQLTLSIIIPDGYAIVKTTIFDLGRFDYYNATVASDGRFTLRNFANPVLNIFDICWYVAPSSGTTPPTQSPTTPSRVSDIDVILDGRPLSFDVPPQIVDGRTLVPLRAIFEALGAEVNWNETTQTITGTKDGTTVVLPLGSTTPTVNGQTVIIDVPAMVQNGRTLVPLRFVAEALDVNVNWYANARIITIIS